MVTMVVYPAETNVEKVFCIFSILILTGVFGYSLNKIGEIVTTINKKNADYSKDILML